MFCIQVIESVWLKCLHGWAGRIAFFLPEGSVHHLKGWVRRLKGWEHPAAQICSITCLPTITHSIILFAILTPRIGLFLSFYSSVTLMLPPNVPKGASKNFPACDQGSDWFLSFWVTGGYLRRPSGFSLMWRQASCVLDEHFHMGTSHLSHRIVL